jgi:hypothetical protein
MVVVAPRSAKLVERNGARQTLLFGYVFVLLGFLTMLLLWKEDISYWKVALGYSFVGIGVGLAGTPAFSLPDRLRPREAGRHGIGDRGSPARPRRGDHAVDLRRSLTAGYAAAAGAAVAASGKHINSDVQSRADEVIRERSRYRSALPALGPGPDHRRRQDLLPQGRPVGLHGRHRRRAARRRARVLHVPQA